MRSRYPSKTYHYVPVLARKPGALRNGAPFKDWVLPGAIERVRRRLAGSHDGDRQMVDILGAVLSDGLAVEAACAAALKDGVFSSDVILNILARAREPEPPPPILTLAIQPRLRRMAQRLRRRQDDLCAPRPPHPSL